MPQLPNDILSIMDSLFYFCLKNNVSDLHFEALSNSYRLRYRRHGRLLKYQDIPSYWLMRIMQRIKVLSKLDILNTETPQDGQWIWHDSHQVQSIPCRLSFCPMFYGEKLAIRLLFPYRQYQNWYELGLNSHQIQHIQEVLHQKQGLILVNGPTGSGKTTSLYHFIDYLNDGSLNIISIEDPIEIPNPHINQIQANPKRGFGLAKTLKYVLRQDPDIILIGEIRDEETAKLAIQAAHTGHLVLSSLHASHAKASFERLKQLGIHKNDIRDEILLIIAQRLIPFYDQDGDILMRQAIFELMNAKGEYLSETLQDQYHK
jgi:protein transport protein HofB